MGLLQVLLHVYPALEDFPADLARCRRFGMEGVDVIPHAFVCLKTLSTLCAGARYHSLVVLRFVLLTAVSSVINVWH